MSESHQTMIPQHPKSPFNEKGFTLLEVMAAMAIIAIAMVGIYQMQGTSIKMSARARFYTIAPLLAQIKMSDFDANLNEMTSGDSGEFEEDGYAGFSWRVETEDIESEIFGDSSQIIKRIDLKISLNEDELVYKVQTYRYLFAE